jgi:acylphosphatase
MTTQPGGPTRLHVLYSGRVQGVNFRATAQEFARKHAVVGWVRNLDDGRVEMEAEGSPRHVEALLADIAAQFAGYIRDVEKRSIAAKGEERGFLILH